MAISFVFQTPFTLKERRKIKQWIRSTIEQHGKQHGDITYIFTDDEHLLRINKEYLQHDYYTDIITFDYVEGETISGDLFLSTERILENAKQNQWDEQTEILRVIIHGILHLLGYKDHRPSEAQHMREAEEQALQHYHTLTK